MSLGRVGILGELHLAEIDAGIFFFLALLKMCCPLGYTTEVKVNPLNIILEITSLWNKIRGSNLNLVFFTPFCTTIRAEFLQ